MTQFLRQVAEHYQIEGDMSRKCFIFPNRRSMVFFTRWLSNAVKETKGSKPEIAPVMMTMNDFFYRASGSAVTDRVSLLLELYDCYKSLNSKAESLDDFIFWGDVILSDFDDTDKYLADAKSLYTNVAEFKDIQDSYSYLTDVQLNAIRQFISHFRKGGKLTVNLGSDNPNVKEKFLMIWNLLYPLYKKFNKALTEKGLAYEGMAYRVFAERLKKESASDILADKFPGTEKFVFVGLNALNECEKLSMRKMRDASLAEFCWDYSSDMLRDPMNKASMFMSKNVIEFPQTFDIDGVTGIAPAKASGADMRAGADSRGPEIRVLSVPSAVGMAKYIPEVLKEIADKRTGGDLSKVGRLDIDGADTAIVIPDEGMLAPLLNTIPEEIVSVNVTMGYPMSGSAIHSLMKDVAALQLHLRKKKDGWAFYHAQVWAVLASGIFQTLAGEEGKKFTARIKNDAKYYIPESDLKGFWLADLIFRPVVTDPKAVSADQIRHLEEYQLQILSEIGAKISEMPSMALETHFAKQYYLSINRLKALTLNIVPMTYVRLLQQLVGGVSVPFKGEPLKGLQIMGPLETRALDFSNLIILSCNEGIFPRRSVSSSFIPPELRKGFGLPTYENQDAVWAYYFYRMIQRAGNVWMMYDSRTEGMKSGEESRYIKQLTYQYKYPLMQKEVLRYKIDIADSEKEVAKTQEDLERIKSMTYSASSLKKYLSCPAQFYYASVKKLQPEVEVAESMDGGMVGSVFHDTMYALYLGGEALNPQFSMERENVVANVKNPLKLITKDYIDWLLENRDSVIRPKVRALIQQQLKSDEVTGRNLVLEDVINQYVIRTLKMDKSLMKGDGFEILGLELERHWQFEGFRFVGYVDRMDSFEDGRVRIVDYKTGKVEDTDVGITESNFESVAESLFAEISPKRQKIALQLFLYDMFTEAELKGRIVDNVIYPVPKLFSADSIMSAEKCEQFNIEVKKRLKGVFAELSNPDAGFRRTEDRNVCKYCDFRKICGR